LPCIAENDAGVIMRSVGREAMQLEYRGRRLKVDVDRAPGNYGVYLPHDPRWEDGVPVEADLLPILRAAIVEIFDHWGIRVEFINQ
jgi:hypothetical protein